MFEEIQIGGKYTIFTTRGLGGPVAATITKVIYDVNGHPIALIGESDCVFNWDHIIFMAKIQPNQPHFANVLKEDT